MLRELAILIYLQHPNIAKLKAIHFNPKIYSVLII